MPRLVLVALLGLLLVGCATTPRGYRITLKDGREIQSTEFPVLIEETGYYRCEDAEGKLRVFREHQVASIVPQTQH